MRQANLRAASARKQFKWQVSWLADPVFEKTCGQPSPSRQLCRRKGGRFVEKRRPTPVDLSAVPVAFQTPGPRTARGVHPVSAGSPSPLYSRGVGCDWSVLMDTPVAFPFHPFDMTPPGTIHMTKEIGIRMKRSQSINASSQRLSRTASSSAATSSSAASTLCR